MFNKIYDDIKTFIKENFKFLISIIIIVFLFTYKIPYYIYLLGGTINIDERILIDNEYDNKGSFNLSYVSELHATIPTYLLSYLFGFERVKIADYLIDENDNAEDILYRSKMYLTEANQNAIKVAYEYANQDFTINDIKHNIIYIASGSETTLEVGDRIISIEGIEVDDIKLIREVISTKELDDIVNFIVVRKDKNGNDITVEATAKVKLLDDEKVIGIYTLKLYDFETYPGIMIKFKTNESGPSGGLMTTLSIYNKLISEDITNGLKIVGTGTIDETGNVGEISGIKYKLGAAVRDDADIFFVAMGENYEEAIRIKEEKKYDIEIVGVKTFYEAVEYLNSKKNN